MYVYDRKVCVCDRRVCVCVCVIGENVRGESVCVCVIGENVRGDDIVERVG